MLSGAYSRELNDLETRASEMVAIGQDPLTASADLNDWAGVLVDAVGQMYLRWGRWRSRPCRGRSWGSCVSSGVGDPANPRGSRYLPTAVRHRLMARETDS